MPDWRDEAAYRPLLDADRSLIAWEWLRRDPCYRATAQRCTARETAVPGGARQFGLVAFEPPHLAVPAARPMWCSALHPFVLLAARGASVRAADLVALDRVGHFARLLSLGQSEHMLLSDGRRAVRLDGPPGTFSDGPADFFYVIHGFRSAEPPLIALRRFLALVRTGSFARSLHRPEPRARRWILMLRAADALAEGASQREIAQVLLSRSAGEINWRSRAPSLRLQAQRLVRSARRFASGDYRLLLR